MKYTLLAIVMLVIAPLANAGSVIVVHAANSGDISKSDVKKIYLGKKGAFNNGTPATPITLPEGNEQRGNFNKSILGKSPSQYVAYWAKMVFTGNANPPKEVASMKEMKDAIAADPGAIGFIDESMVDDSLRVIEKF